MTGLTKFTVQFSNMAPGCFRTDHGNFSCVTCEVLKETDRFNSVRKPRRYNFRIKEHLTCTSSYVVYLVNCLRPSCMEQYVGCTETELKQRHRIHRHEIRNQTTPFGEHFSKHKRFELIAIEQVPNNDINLLLKREKFWITKLDACSINVHHCRQEEQTSSVIHGLITFQYTCH